MLCISVCIRFFLLYTDIDPGLVYKWSLSGTLYKLIRIRNVWGIIALLCMDAFYFLSTPYVREKAYNLFLRSHIISVILVLPAVSLFCPLL